MSELTLTLLRLGFLVALWLFVFGTLSVLRRDLIASSRPLREQRVHPLEVFRQQRQRRRAHLVITRSDGTVQRLELTDQAVSFGRDEDNTVCLDDDYTSSHHARISARERGWAVEDCGSTNGTWVDRKRITSPMPLVPGMKVRIGRSEVSVNT